jgi:hypothetical protein
VFLAEVTAYDPVEKKLVEVRMCSRGHGKHIAFPEFPDDEYIPCITTPPQQTVTLNENGIPGQIQIEYGNLGISFSRQLRNTHWRRYDFDGYPCRLLYGDVGAPYSTYELVPGSKLGSLDNPTVDTGSFAIRGPEVDLTRDILTESYGGTGGADGREDRKNTLKPFAIGQFENWEAVLVDPVNLIYQYHGYGPTGDVTAVYENALTLGPSRLSVRTYEELVALTAEQLPPGSWAKAPAVGMFRLGAEPYGKLTLDGIGALDGAVAPMGVASICAFMLRRFADVPADKIDMVSVADLEREFPHTWGNVIDAQTKPDDTQDDQISYSVGDFVREAMAHVAGYVFATPDGVWHFGRNVSTKDPIVLRQSRASKPVVTSISSPATSTRVQRVRVGGRRCFSTHTDSEISDALKQVQEEIANGLVPVKEAVEEVKQNVDDIRQFLPDLVTPLLREPIAKVSALQLKYGAGQIKAAFALHDQALVAVREIGTRVDENGNKVAEEMLQLTSRVTEAEAKVAGIDIDGPIEAGLAEIRRTIANTEYALSEEINLKIANYGDGVSAWQNEEVRVRAERDSALAEDIDQLGARITTEVGGVRTDLEGAFNDLRELVLDGESNTALALRIDEMGVRITTEIGDETKAREAAIQTIEKTQADDRKAAAERSDTISSQVTDITKDGGPISVINGIIQTMQKTQADNNGARAEETRTLQARLDNFNGASLEQSFNAYANKVDGIGAQYTLKVQTDQNGQKFIAGMGIAIEDGVSAIAFTTDSFRISTPGANPQQVFYADADGVYMPNVRVGKITFDAMDEPFTLNSQINADSGYQELPGGLILQWGKVRGYFSGGLFPITFAKPYTQALFTAQATPFVNFHNSRDQDAWVHLVGNTMSTTGFSVTIRAGPSGQSLNGFDWWAVGR